MIKLVEIFAVIGIIGCCASSATPTVLPQEDLELATMRDGGDADLTGDGIVDLRVRKQGPRTTVERLERGRVWHCEVFFLTASLGVNIDANRDGRWELVRRTTIDSDGSSEEVLRDEDSDGVFDVVESVRVDLVSKTRRVVLKRLGVDGKVRQVSDETELLFE